MTFELQPQIENEFVKIVPLGPEDFDALFKIASDPLIWEQHPNKNRYLKEVFEIFLKGAIESKGAFIVYDNKNGEPIGSSRFYDWDETKKSISIGYTFFARKCWGEPYNKSLKTLMLNHAFKFVDTVAFHIGANNIRSQKAISKLGALKIAEEEMNYYGEQNTLNFIYKIEKVDWEILKKIPN